MELLINIMSKRYFHKKIKMKTSTVWDFQTILWKKDKKRKFIYENDGDPILEVEIETDRGSYYLGDRDKINSEIQKLYLIDLKREQIRKCKEEYNLP